MAVTDEYTTIDLARRKLGEGLTEMMTEALATDEADEVARALAALRDLKQDAGTVYADVEKHLLACMGEHQLEVPGLGVVESKRRTKRTAWNHDELVRDVVSWTVEATGSDFPAPYVVTDALRECISFGAGKVTGLRARGLQPDEYCQETPDGYSIQLPPRDHSQDVA